MLWGYSIRLVLPPPNNLTSSTTYIPCKTPPLGGDVWKSLRVELCFCPSSPQECTCREDTPHGIGTLNRTRTTVSKFYNKYTSAEGPPHPLGTCDRSCTTCVRSRRKHTLHTGRPRPLGTSDRICTTLSLFHFHYSPPKGTPLRPSGMSDRRRTTSVQHPTSPQAHTPYGTSPSSGDVRTDQHQRLEPGTFMNSHFDSKYTRCRGISRPRRGHSVRRTRRRGLTFWLKV